MQSHFGTLVNCVRLTSQSPQCSELFSMFGSQSSPALLSWWRALSIRTDGPMYISSSFPSQNRLNGALSFEFKRRCSAQTGPLCLRGNIWRAEVLHMLILILKLLMKDCKIKKKYQEKYQEFFFLCLCFEPLCASEITTCVDELFLFKSNPIIGFSSTKPDCSWITLRSTCETCLCIYSIFMQPYSHCFITGSQSA